MVSWDMPSIYGGTYNLLTIASSVDKVTAVPIHRLAMPSCQDLWAGYGGHMLAGSDYAFPTSWPTGRRRYEVQDSDCATLVGANI